MEVTQVVQKTLIPRFVPGQCAMWGRKTGPLPRCWTSCKAAYISPQLRVNFDGTSTFVELKPCLLTMAHTNSVMTIADSGTVEALSDVWRVDGDDGRVGIKSASTLSQCCLERSQGLSVMRLVESSVQLY